MKAALLLTSAAFSLAQPSQDEGIVGSSASARLTLPSGGAAACCGAGCRARRAAAGIACRGPCIAGFGSGGMGALALADPQVVLHVGHAGNGLREILGPAPLVAVTHG